VAFHPVKINKLWIWKALDRADNRTVAWTLGNRNAATFKELYSKVKGKGRTYFADDWDVYRKVLPKQQHIIGKSGTIAIERDNSNTRHYLARMTRRTKVVSKSVKMVDLSLRLLDYFMIPDNYKLWQERFLSVFSITLLSINIGFYNCLKH